MSEHSRGYAARSARTCLSAVACAAALGTPAVDAQAPAQHRLAISPGDTVAWSTVGSGAPVVIVPGLLGSAYSFRHVIPSLVRAGHRVVVVEPLGTGASARPERADYTLEGQATRIEHVLNAAGVSQAVFLCHSVGASMCYRFALRAPGRVHGIVAVNGGPDEQAATSGLRLALRFAGVMRLLGGDDAILGRLRDGLVNGSADPSWVTEETVAGYIRPFRGDPHAALRALRGMAAAKEPAPLAPRLRDIQAPVLLLVGAGARNRVIGAAELDVLVRGLPQLDVDTVARAGQYIQEEAPAAVVEAVLDMQRRVDGGGSRPGAAPPSRSPRGAGEGRPPGAGRERAPAGRPPAAR